MWMYHCHILEHADAGMMGHLHVIDPNAPASAAPETSAHMHMHMPTHAESAGAAAARVGGASSDGDPPDAQQ
jgi:hypothetical protein